MQRLMFVALLGLTLAIGSTIGMLAWRETSFGQPRPDLGAADPAIGYAFYAGFDQVLAGTGRDGLDRIVADGFVDHEGNSKTDRSADELVETLTAFGLSFPGTKIVVSDIEAAPGTLVASIGPVAVRGTIAGLPLQLPSNTSGYEVLRVRDGKVTERWSAGLTDVAPQTFTDAVFSMGATFNRSIHLDVVTLPAGAMLQTGVMGEHLLMSQSGTARIRMSWVDQSVGPKTARRELSAGEGIRLISGSSIQIEADGDTPAVLLRFSMQSITPRDPHPPTMTGGATIQSLWSSNLPAATGDTWNVTSGNARLPAAERAHMEMSEGTLVLVCSEQGGLELATDAGLVSTLDAQFWPVALGSASLLDAGQAAEIEQTGSIDLRSDKGDRVWVIAIVPGNAPGTAAASPVAQGTPLGS